MLLTDYTMKLTDFDPEADTYSRRNALFLGEASQAAYASPEAGDPNGMQAWAGMAGFTACAPFGAVSGYFQNGRIEGFIATTDSLLLVSFRGTDPTIGDWLLDFETAMATDPFVPGHVHRGFNGALLSVWSQIRPHLDNRGERRVWITGHSLGGALAVACAARATFENPRVGVRGIYTYGQPRYGNEICSSDCAQLLGSVMFRHVNNRDIVPRVPPFLLGFRHWGTEILFDRTEAAHVNPSPVEGVRDLWWQLKTDPFDLSPLRALLTRNEEEDAIRRLREESFEVATDHFLTNAYLPVLRKALDGE
jgi:triacylglycerol lipase